jgi:hypothetical protein
MGTQHSAKHVGAIEVSKLSYTLLQKTKQMTSANQNKLVALVVVGFTVRLKIISLLPFSVAVFAGSLFFWPYKENRPILCVTGIVPC